MGRQYLRTLGRSESEGPDSRCRAQRYTTSLLRQSQRRKMDLTQIQLQEGAAPPMQDQFHAFINSSGPVQTHYRKASIQKRKRGVPDANSNGGTTLEGAHMPPASAETSPSPSNAQLGDGEHKSGSRNTGKGAADGAKKKKANRACCHCQKAHLTCDDCEYDACGTGVFLLILASSFATSPTMPKVSQAWNGRYMCGGSQEKGQVPPG